jgi:hypothetical protein
MLEVWLTLWLNPKIKVTQLKINLNLQHITYQTRQTKLDSGENSHARLTTDIKGILKKREFGWCDKNFIACPPDILTHQTYYSFRLVTDCHIFFVTVTEPVT